MSKQNSDVKTCLIHVKILGLDFFLSSSRVELLGTIKVYSQVFSLLITPPKIGCVVALAQLSIQCKSMMSLTFTSLSSFSVMHLAVLCHLNLMPYESQLMKI